MEKKADPSLFVNDGSFMEKFKQLQQEQLDQMAKEPKNSAASTTVPYPPKSGLIMGKRPLDVKATESKKPSNSSSNVKLAFSLKQKSKIAVAPVKLGGDEEEGEDLGLTLSEQSGKKQKLEESTESSMEQKDVGNYSLILHFLFKLRALERHGYLIYWLESEFFFFFFLFSLMKVYCFGSRYILLYLSSLLVQDTKLKKLKLFQIS